MMATGLVSALRHEQELVPRIQQSEQSVRLFLDLIQCCAPMSPAGYFLFSFYCQDELASVQM